MYCVQLTRQEQENVGYKAHLTALPGALSFYVCLGCKLECNYHLFVDLTGRYTGSQNSNSAIYVKIYLVTACADIKGMCCYQGMLHDIDFPLVALGSAKIVS